MPSARELGKRFGGHMQKQIESLELPANIGFKLPSGNYSVRGDDSNIKLLPANKCYVRILGEDAQTQVALTGMVTVYPDLPVMVRRNFRGELYVSGVDWSRAWEYLEEQLNDFATPPKSGAGFDTVPASSITAARLLWADKTAMTVKVQAFYYRYLDSTKLWAGSTTLNLADYLPATTSNWQWVVVCIDPKDNTITAVEGTEHTTKLSLDTADLLSIDTSGLIACAGVTVQEAQTAYNRAKNTIEYLPVLHEANAPVVAEEYGTGLIGASRQIRVEGTVTVSGVLTVKGRLIAA